MKSPSTRGSPAWWLSSCATVIAPLPPAANSGQYDATVAVGIERAPLDQQVGAHRRDALRRRVHEHDRVGRPRPAGGRVGERRPRGRRPERPSTYTHTAAPTSPRVVEVRRERVEHRLERRPRPILRCRRRPRAVPYAAMTDARSPRYTHGHHESGAALAPLAHRRELRGVPRSPTSRRARRSSTSAAGRARSPLDIAGRVAPGQRDRRRRRGRRRSRRRAPRPRARARPTSSSAPPTCTRSTSPTTRSTSCTRTRCCNTSPTRSARCARCAACASRAASSPRATATTPRSPGTRPTPTLDAWLALYRDDRPREPRRARRRAASSSRGRTRPASPTSSPARPRGASPRPRTATWWGDALGRPHHRVGDRRPGRRDRRRDHAPSSTRWPTPGARWAADPDAWFAVLHGEILCEGVAPTLRRASPGRRRSRASGR